MGFPTSSSTRPWRSWGRLAPTQRSGFTCGFAEAETGRPRAGNFVGYCGREALMALLDLAGPRSYDLTDAVKAVLEAADQREQENGEDAPGAAIERLRAADDGPGPHARRLEALIVELSRRTPARTEADLFARFVTALGELNRLTHNKAPADLERARQFLREAFSIATRLFAPMMSRLNVIDELIAAPAPGAGEVAQLLGWHGDPRILSYFFARVQSPGWFRALADHSLLGPPENSGMWPALGYLQRLGQSDPDELAGWLAGRPRGRELTGQQAFLLVQLARTIRAPVDAVVLPMLRGHLGDPNILHLVVTYMEERPTTGQDISATFGILKTALQAVVEDEHLAGRSYLSAELLGIVVRLAERSDALRWLGVLGAKVRALLPDDGGVGTWYIRRIGDITQLQIDTADDVLEQFVACLRDVNRIATHAGVIATERGKILGQLPPPLAGRMLATDLLDAESLDLAAGVALLRAEVPDSDPMPETLALLRRLVQSDAPELVGAMIPALGPAPDATTVAALGPEEAIPRAWGHVYGWSAALPEAVTEPWSAAIAVCEQRWGAPMPDGLVMPRAVASFRSHASPYTVEDLRADAPVEACRKIAAWAPDPDDDFGPSRRGLANVLKDLIALDPAAWRAADCEQLIAVLGHPLYVLAYFETLADDPAEVLPDTVLNAIEETARLVGREWDPYDRDTPPRHDIWRAMLPALTRLDLTDSTIRERVWTVLETAFDTHEKAEPGMPNIAAAGLAAAIGVADATMVDDRLPAELTSMLTVALELKGPLAASLRPVLAVNLPWLLWRASTWTHEHWSHLIGDDAPDKLGRDTFDVYLQRGRPTTALLLILRERIWDALRTTPAAAAAHILYGMLWQVDGYDPAAVVAAFSATGDSAISDAARWLWTAGTQNDELDLGPVLAFWEEAVNRALPPESYEGFGCLATIDRLDPERWLDLTLRTARLCRTGLALPEHVANRAAGHAPDPRALQLVAALLHARLQLWHIYAIGRIGVELLRTVNGVAPEVRSELRERLVEREFFEARDL